MAKGKGKSERRFKNWQQMYDAGENMEDRDAQRGRSRPRAVKIPSWRLEAEQPTNLEELPRREGMVVGQFPGGVIVRSEGEDLLCGLAGTFRPPAGASALAVCDEVTVALTRPRHAGGETDADKDRADGLILSRNPRRTVLSRPQPRSGKRRDDYDDEVFEKVIAANVDQLLIVAATKQPPLRHGLIDRFLIIAERGELDSVLVINKADLRPPEEAVLADFRALDVPIITTSAVTRAGLDDLKAVLTGKVSVLAGASGVGKTTLVNALLPDVEAATRSVRMKDERGRHTTTASAVYELPFGGRLVDTPGLRELGIHLDSAELPWYFPEFEELAARCKFRNCTHTHEPDCAVRQAVEDGGILPRRYESYLRILDTLDEH